MDTLGGVRRHKEGWVNSVAYSPNGVEVVSGSSDDTIRLLEVPDGMLRRKLEGYEYSVTSVAYSPSGVEIASGSGDWTVRLWDALSGVQHHKLEGHEGKVNSVAYSPNGAEVVSGSSDDMRWVVNSGRHK